MDQKSGEMETSFLKGSAEDMMWSRPAITVIAVLSIVASSKLEIACSTTGVRIKSCS
jgi:hypothetical protein